MRKRNNKWMGMDEALKIIMQRTGKNRKEAEASLLEAMRSGKIPARAYDLETDEPLGPVPPEVFGPQRN